MPKTAAERLRESKPEKRVVLDKDFAGVKAGLTLFVANPKIVDQYIRDIPTGQSRTIVQMRRALAQSRNADATCPVSTAIFLRIAAQAAIDEMEDGCETELVSPFWRVLRASDKITERLTIDRRWIDTQRGLEGLDL
jgi:hypothetical protein|tara:strand:- start:268 stop:678 length:411 start_codon:yes stop_codon:yes gene_type:complete